jgi:hypothetical protein
MRFESRHPAEAVAQRRGEQTRARGSSDQCEARQLQAHGARTRPLTDQEVEMKVLHGRVENLLDGRRQPVDLVDEEHVTRFQVREQRREIAGALDGGATRRAQRRADLAGHDARQGRLAQTRRAVEEQVIEDLPALPGGADEDGEVRAQSILTDHLVQALRAQRLLEANLLGRRLGTEIPAALRRLAHRDSPFNAART